MRITWVQGATRGISLRLTFQRGEGGGELLFKLFACYLLPT